MGNVNAIFPFFCVKCAYPCKRTPFFFNSFPEIHISDADSRPAAAQKEKTGVPFSGRRFSLSKNLVEFAPAGAKKVQSFSSATCAAKKILLGLQTCAPSASGGQRVRCSQAADPFVKKYSFLTDATPPVPQHRGCPLWCFSNRQRSALTGRDTSATALPPAHPSRAAV